MAVDLGLRAVLKQSVEQATEHDSSGKILLLSCIDSRYPERIFETMDDLGYRDRYYHLALAGASHGAKHDAHWKSTFNDHLDFAVTEGHVTGVVILDHLDCRAYQLYEGTSPGDPEGERLRHIAVATNVVNEIVLRHSILCGNVTAYLLPVESAPPEIARS